MTIQVSKQYTYKTEFKKVISALSTKAYWESLVGNREGEELISFEVANNQVKILINTASPDMKIETALGEINNANMLFIREISVNNITDNSATVDTDLRVKNLPATIFEKLELTADGTETTAKYEATVHSKVAPIKKRSEKIIAEQIENMTEKEIDSLDSWVKNNG